MTDFTLSVTDPDLLAGISFACAQYNASISRFEEGVLMNPEDVLTDAGYVEYVMTNAFKSYRDQKLQNDLNTAVESAKAGDATALQGVASKMATAAANSEVAVEK